VKKEDAKDAVDATTTKVRELGAFIREQRKGAQLSLRNLASMAGVSNPYLSQIERGLRKPSAEILQAIAKALRISAETLYVKAGILEESDDDLAARIQADSSLTEKQKRALVEVYLSFRQGVVPPEPTDEEAAAVAERLADAAEEAEALAADAEDADDDAPSASVTRLHGEDPPAGAAT
jgi:transcriptional regulator with XRE-family HTH domain